MHTTQRKIEERTNLASLNQFELLLLKLSKKDERDTAEANEMGHGLVTSITKLDNHPTHGNQLIQVLDVEEILQCISPVKHGHQNQLKTVRSDLSIKPGTIVLAVDDSAMARALLKNTLQTMNLPHESAGNYSFISLRYNQRRARTSSRC